MQATVTLYGISDLRSIGKGFPDAVQKVHKSPAVTEALLVNSTVFGTFPGASIASNPEKALAASSMGHRQGKKPPFLILHGTADTLVPPMQSRHLYDALKAGGNDAELIMVDGAGHGDIYWYQAPIIDRVVTWFKKTLGGPIEGAAKATSHDANL